MRPKDVLVFIFLFCQAKGHAQSAVIDSLTRALKNNPAEKTVRVDILNRLAFENHLSNPSESIEYSDQARALSKKLNYSEGLALSFRHTGLAYWTQALYVNALNFFYSGLKIADSLNFTTIQADIAGNIGLTQSGMGHYSEALKSFETSLKKHQELKNVKRQIIMLNNIGDCHIYLNQLDKALESYNQSLALSETISMSKTTSILVETNCRNIGNVYELKNDLREAEKFYLRAKEIDDRLKEGREMALICKSLASLYWKQGKIEMAERLIQEAIALAKEGNYRAPLRDAYFLSSKIKSSTGHYQQALAHFQLASAYKDSIENLASISKFAALQREHDLEQKQNQIDFLNREKELNDKELSRTNLLLISTTLGFVMLALFLYSVIRNYRFHKAVNTILRDRNMEISQQNNLLNDQKQKLKALNEEVTSQREEVTAQRDILADKTKQIEKLNIELSSMNYMLEQKVSERTFALEIQNKALAEYAFINAHKLRAPVATILGLIGLLQRKHPTDNYDQLVQHLKTTSEKLDNITRSISSKLEVGQSAFDNSRKSD